VSTMRELAATLVGDVLTKIGTSGGAKRAWQKRERSGAERREAEARGSRRMPDEPRTPTEKRPPIKGFDLKDAKDKWPSRRGGEGVYYAETPESVDEGEPLVRIEYEFEPGERQTRDEPGSNPSASVLSITDADGRDITDLYGADELVSIQDNLADAVVGHFERSLDKAISPSAAHRRSKLAWESRRHGAPGVYMRPDLGEEPEKKPAEKPKPEVKIDDAAAYAKLSPRDQLREKAKAGGEFAWHDDGLAALVGASRDTPLKTVAGRVVATDAEINLTKNVAYLDRNRRVKNEERAEDERGKRNADIDARGQDEGHRQHLRRMINMANAITDWEKAFTRGTTFNAYGMLDAARLFWHRGALLNSEGKAQVGKSEEPIELSDILSPRWARPHSVLAAPSPPTHRPF